MKKRESRARTPRIVGSAALAVLLVLLGTTPASAATWYTFYNGSLANNTWTWSGHYSSQGGSAQENSPYDYFPVKLMVSGSSTIYSSKTIVTVSWSTQVVSIACGHNVGYSLPMTCKRYS
ncbi:hypothetical protein [Microbacterium sp. RU33B]|uniref:hypothetical protein n=1 Tax=Microbacterium sp. RU33B TaxID=1907390 RepID=UPI00095E7AC0|nr:hypothetical protein [Microbacterium sp. RU33B]SIT72085.1 hypothetical protein SAMN05880545_0993 [Microbacterium sp. RU33B]